MSDLEFFETTSIDTVGLYRLTYAGAQGTSYVIGELTGLARPEGIGWEIELRTGVATTTMLALRDVVKIETAE